MEKSFAETLSFQHTFDRIKDIACITLDMESNIRFWSLGATLLYEYSADEVVGKHTSIIQMDDPDASTLFVSTEDHSRTEERWQKRRDGSIFWAKVTTTRAIDRNGQVVGYHCIVQQLSVVGIGLTLSGGYTGKQNAGEVLDYAVILLDKNGQIRYADKAAEKLKRYTIAEMTGLHLRVFYSRDDQDNGLPETLLAEAAKNGRIFYEGWRVRKDGSIFYGSALLTALTDRENNVVGYYKVFRDLTGHQQAREAELLYIDQLERHSSEVEELAYISSHDLKEPLRTILGFVEILRDQRNYEDSNSTALIYINYIQQSARRMQQLIEGILEYSLIGANKVATSVDLGEILNEVETDLAQAMTSTGAKIIRDPLPIITGFKTELRQLFQNLISNAIKFHKPDIAPVINISAAFVSDAWIIAIRDNGIGFDPEQSDRIFKIFQRLNRRTEYEGTGIGLSYAKKIVTLHNGEIWAESVPGQGSTFYFTIPARLPA